MSVFDASVQSTKWEITSPADKQHHQQDHNVYQTLSDANIKAGNAEISLRHVHWEFNVFRHIPCIVRDLPNTNLVHTMQISMTDHLQKWNFPFMKTHERLDKYNAIWLSVPAYHDITPKTKSTEEVSQWNGKEMKEMSQYQLGVVTQALQGGSPAQHPISNCPIECTRALLEFYMYARYKSHNDATLCHMEVALHRFHTFKDVFLLGRAGKRAKAKSNTLRTQLMKKRTVDKETNPETWTASKKRREMNAWREYISHEIDVSKELDADFPLPMIHLMSPWVEQICWYGAFQQYSADRHEQARKTNFKDGWNASNHTVNYLPQVITFQRRILFFVIRELKLQACAQHRENCAATCKVLSSGAAVAAPLSSQSYAKPEFMRPQTCRDGKHPDAMIEDFRALLTDLQDAMLRVTIYNGTREFIKHKSRNNTYISDVQLHPMELCIYNGINV